MISNSYCTSVFDGNHFDVINKFAVGKKLWHTYEILIQRIFDWNAATDLPSN